MATSRETEDKLYTDFQSVLEGANELTEPNAEYVFNNPLIPDAQSIAIILSAQTPSILVP